MSHTAFTQQESLRHAQTEEGNRIGGYTVQVADLMRPEMARAKARELAAARKRGLTPSQGVLEIADAKKQKTLKAMFAK